jgi:glutamate dehydrogenase
MPLGVARDEAQRASVLEGVLSVARHRLAEEDRRQAEALLPLYYSRTPLEDLEARSQEDLFGAAWSHWLLARDRRPGVPAIRAYTPELSRDGWRSPHSVVQFVDDDFPFLVDSIRMALTRRGLGMHLVVHPVVGVQRDAAGRPVGVVAFKDPGRSPERASTAAPESNGAAPESFVHLEFDRQGDAGVLEGLEVDLRAVEADVRAAVQDWPAMLDVLEEAARELEDASARRQLEMEASPDAGGPSNAGGSPDAGQLAESAAFLRWLAGGHFTFLGYREYQLTAGDCLVPVPGTGLGILGGRREGGATAPGVPPAPVVPAARPSPPGLAAARPAGTGAPEAVLAGEVPAGRLSGNPLVLTKALSLSTVHRPSHLDYVGVTRYDAGGRRVGERRFLGLYTSVVYQTHPAEIPVVRQRVRGVVERAGFPPASHSSKELRAILETYPRDELFEVSEQELYETAMGICSLQERQRVKLFLRRDRYGRFFSCLVFVPRDRLDTDTQHRIERVLTDALGGASVECQVHLGESVLARLHVMVYLQSGPDAQRPRQPARAAEGRGGGGRVGGSPTGGVAEAPDVAAIEQRLVAVTRTWADSLRDALVEELGEGLGLELFHRYGEGFPPGYRADFSARAAVEDIKRLEALDPGGDIGINLYHPASAEPGTARLKLYRTGAPLLVSRLLPRLEHMGVLVSDERPYEVMVGGASRWVYDFGLRTDQVGQLTSLEAGRRFQGAFLAVWEGEAEDDGFNRLVVQAGLDWRQVSVIRAYSRYLRQVGTTLSPAYLREAVVAHPDVATLLVQLFEARFDPGMPSDAQGSPGHQGSTGHATSWPATEPGAGNGARQEACALIVDQARQAIDAVSSLDEDRVLRSLLSLILATVRTNAYQEAAGGGPLPYLAVKLDPGQVHGMPQPRPMFEIFIYSPRSEAVHLRGGRVARGGIRWSDRREDYRTEILGLMKAQMVKNAVIVPVGSKGGFVVRQPPDDREALAAEVVASYRTLISGLLDLTDNLENGRVIPPPRVIRYDGDDPYLVVAADKGTATFSDIANSIALERGYWLGDAFASGGSTGYDHKAMGITALGAWESVRRHFADLGIDPDNEELSAVGIGDMSGDVFGNGMLLSRHLKLLAAFDHRHIFIDPNPDPEESYRERERLFRLPRSSWADYDESVISPGGGVFPRAAKSVALSLEAQGALGVDADVLTPDEVVQAILRAPVQLFWNGGIGTFVKASDESHADVGDKHNDSVRIDASELRCRVVAEGGNLGFTQRARVEFALSGGRINTDAIDNSGGVDCSDHEVNLKILLDRIVAGGDLTTKDRNELLASMAEDVISLVVADNRRQTQALANAVAEASEHLDVYRRYIRSLEHAGHLDRALEFLPTDEELEERWEPDAGTGKAQGLTSPELAVLLAYTKNLLYDELLASDLPQDPALAGELARYFPAALVGRFADRLDSHPLRREIVANQVCNELVDRQGITFVYRLREETGASPAELARAWLVARDVLGAPAIWAGLDDAGPELPGPIRTALFLEARRQVGRATRWLLRHRRPPIDVSGEVAIFGPGAAELGETLPGLLTDVGWSGPARALAGTTPNEGISDLTRRVGLLDPLGMVFDLVEVAGETGEALATVAAVQLVLGERLDLRWLHQQAAALPSSSRWTTLARDALRHDLADRHRAMTVAVLRSTDPSIPALDRVESWLAAAGPLAARVQRIMADIRVGGPVDIAKATVAVRECERLVVPGS